MTIRLICLDADDTLWHNMRYLNAAEAALLGMLAPFAGADVSRAALESAEARNLATYGYEAKGFTLSMIETAADLVGERLSADMIRTLLAAGRSLLSHPVELLSGVGDALDALAARGELVLVTKGDLLHQEAKLAASGLGDRFAPMRSSATRPQTRFVACSPVTACGRIRPSWRAILCGPTSFPPCTRAPGRRTSPKPARGAMSKRVCRPSPRGLSHCPISGRSLRLSTASMRARCDADLIGMRVGLSRRHDAKGRLASS